MNYAIGYLDRGNWVFMKHGPTASFPHGYFGTGMCRYETFKRGREISNLEREAWELFEASLKDHFPQRK